jgi:hypothetical protein
MAHEPQATPGPRLAYAAGEPSYKDAWQRLSFALNEMCAHLVATAAVLASIKAIEFLIKFLADGDLIFFRGAGPFEFHVKWLFDAADLGLLMVLTLRIVYVFYRIFRG